MSWYTWFSSIGLSRVIDISEELFFIGSKVAFNHGVFIRAAFVDIMVSPA